MLWERELDRILRTRPRRNGAFDPDPEDDFGSSAKESEFEVRDDREPSRSHLLEREWEQESYKPQMNRRY